MSHLPPLSEHGSIAGFRNVMFSLKIDDGQSPKNNIILVNALCYNLFIVKALICKTLDICTLLGYYVAYSGNSLQTFRANLWVQSSRIKKFKKKFLLGRSLKSRIVRRFFDSQWKWPPALYSSRLNCSFRVFSFIIIMGIVSHHLMFKSQHKSDILLLAA